MAGKIGDIQRSCRALGSSGPEAGSPFPQRQERIGILLNGTAATFFLPVDEEYMGARIQFIVAS